MNVGAELEFYYFPDERTPEPMDKVGYFDLTPSDSARDLRRSTVLMLEKMSIPVEYTFHSSGRSQHGISMRHAEALTMSDAIMTAKHVIRTCAYESGIHASFMPKPIAKARLRQCCFTSPCLTVKATTSFGVTTPRTTCRPLPRATWPASWRMPPKSAPSPTPR